MSNPEHEETTGIIQEEFEQISNISTNGVSLIARTCEKFNIEMGKDEKSAQSALRLMLDYPEAYEFTVSRFYLYSSPNTLSTYSLLGIEDLRIDEKSIDEFRGLVQEWFSKQAKGEHCEVKKFDDQGESLIVIQHGSYLKTIPSWEGSNIRYKSLRPAMEDILVYDHNNHQLQIRARLPKDRQFYLRLFSETIARDPSLSEKALESEIFSLAPVQSEAFNYNGKDPITKADLVGVRLKIYGVSNSVINLSASDIYKAFKHDLGSLNFSSGQLQMAKFRFHILKKNGKITTNTFTIEPPSRTDLNNSSYRNIIENYLVEQGVKLR